MLRKALLSISPFVIMMIAGCPQPAATACADGIDSDGDAFIDAADPGCNGGPEDEDETDPQCNDGIDNDFDGFADAFDPECADNPNAEANLASLPDLRLASDINDVAPFLNVEDVAADDPELLDECYLGAGQRTVLRFNGIIENIGNADLIVGDTDQHQPTYTFNENLQQLEFVGWLNYKFLDDQRNVVATGHKGSFCMIDLATVDGFPQNVQFTDCENGQGVTAGMGDVYFFNLPCQFVDVTGLPPGDYTLQAEVNFTKQLPESDYTNNVIEYPITLQ